MLIMFNKNIILIIFISIVFVCASHEQQIESDHMCKVTRGVLCVKAVLKSIAAVAQSISKIATEIEKHILHKTQINGTLHLFVNFETIFTGSHLPTLQYHEEFFQSNNVDKRYLGDLLLEAHNAMSFYYNSIEDVLKMNDPYSPTTDFWFKQIKHNLKDEIICQYRSILNVYSYEWPLINQIDRIKFSRTTYQEAPSTIHDIHSIVIARLLREWTKRIHSAITILESKFL